MESGGLFYGRASLVLFLLHKFIWTANGRPYKQLIDKITAGGFPPAAFLVKEVY